MALLRSDDGDVDFVSGLLIGLFLGFVHRAEAIEFCDRLRTLPGLYELFLTLTAKPPDAK